MLTGHTIGLHERNESNELLLEDPVSEVDVEEAEDSPKVLYRASFEEHARHHVQYDTIVWVLISLLLVLAWGVGVVMLLYLPVRRYVLQKDISSRRLYVTADEIVYKVTRPSFVPCLGYTKIHKRIPLHLVIDIIIEQGCLQSSYGIHTFRVENIARGKAAPVDELQVHGIFNPGLLRKVIITEAAKKIQEVGSWKSNIRVGEADATLASMGFPMDPSRFQSPGRKMTISRQHSLFESGGAVSGDLMLHKLEEVAQSVKRIESLIGESPELHDK